MSGNCETKILDVVKHIKLTTQEVIYVCHHKSKITVYNPFNSCKKLSQPAISNMNNFATQNFAFATVFPLDNARVTLL